MADLARLKKTRAVARGWLTRNERRLEEVLEREEVDGLEVQEAVEEVDRRLALLDEAQSAYELELPEDELDADLQESAEVREAVQAVRLKATKALKKALGEALSEGSRVGSAAGASSVASQGRHTVRLPKLALPHFSGKIMEWQAFWETFGAAVGSLDLPDITKFSYLKSVLEGEAKATLEGLTLSGDNYTVACDLLKDRYGKKERIIFAHVQALLSLKEKHGRTSTQELRKLYEELMTHVRSLGNLGLQGDNYGVVLTPIILSCLPSDIRMEWAREENKESDLAWLLAFLKTEIERRERSEAYKEARPFSTVKYERKLTGAVRPATAAALQTRSVQRQVGLECGFCNGSHHADKCPEVIRLSIPERERRVREAGLCFRCLLPGHFARGCGSKCKRCNGRHHQICCTRETSGTSPPAPVRSSACSKPRVQSSGTGPKVDAVRDGAHVTLANAGSQRSVGSRTLFQTAEVVVSGRGNVTATLLFDSGSDHTYVTSSLVRKVQPKFLTSKKIGYAPFGGGKTRPVDRNVYEIVTKGLNQGDELVMFSALEVPVISAPLSC